MTGGCPRCKADRIKAAPVSVVSPVVNLVSERRRYRCAECGWAGWRRRLRRREQAAHQSSRRSGTPFRARMFFWLLIAAILSSGAFAYQSCEFERPASPGEPSS